MSTLIHSKFGVGSLGIYNITTIGLLQKESSKMELVMVFSDVLRTLSNIFDESCFQK